MEIVINGRDGLFAMAVVMLLLAFIYAFFAMCMLIWLAVTEVR